MKNVAKHYLLFIHSKQLKKTISFVYNDKFLLKMRKNFLLGGIVLPFSMLVSTKNAKADEGMWLPLLLKSLCESDMQARGLKLSAEDIYSINHSSLKDAVVLFGGGCTAEVVSNTGLLFTNHHCGIGQVQAHSTIENDYIKNGFWANSLSNELPNQNLSVTFIIRIEDVSSAIKEILISETVSQKIIAEKMDELERKAVEGTGYDAEIKAFDYGNSYYMFITETFKDIRLVGAPPQALGEFGGDTDNWMWPRHTADFSIFRIYANKENKPAEYSAENIPYIPKKYLTININGVKENDFAMVYGFPGRTQQYLPSSEVEFIMNVSNPNRILMRDKSLEIINESMRASDKVRIQYTAKESRISNAWKKWKGEITGLKKTNALESKKKFELSFNERINSDENLKKRYNSLIPEMELLFIQNRDVLVANDFFTELFYQSGPELLKFSINFENLINNFETLKKDGKLKDLIAKLKNSASVFYKNLDPATDKNLFASLIPFFLKNVSKNFHPPFILKELQKKKENIQLVADVFYQSSLLSKGDELIEALDKPEALISKLKKDKIYQTAIAFIEIYRKKIESVYKAHTIKHDQLMSVYVAAIYEVMKEKKIWYDANSTLRLSYGVVQGSEPRDGTHYNYYTTTDGMIEKFNSGAEEYKLPTRFLELNSKKDFGQYADTDGNLRTCFTTTSQTTGGNSGSPVLNANGELIGLNFDRSWESTMSDINYSSKLCRNIVCDVRYVLFVIEKYAGADRLMKELNIIKSDLGSKK